MAMQFLGLIGKSMVQPVRCFPRRPGTSYQQLFEFALALSLLPILTLSRPFVFQWMATLSTSIWILWNRHIFKKDLRKVETNN